MADAKALKIAAARKKLKEFQGKSKTSASSKTAGPNEVFNVEKPDNSNITIPNMQEPENSGVGEVNMRNVPESQEITIKSVSPSESLRQISMQLNGLVSQTHDYSNGAVLTEDSSTLTLEKRNQELASSLKFQTQSNEQLNHQVQDLKAQIAKLQQQMKKERTEFDETLFKEQSSLRDQLQVHIQTIGILVAEKTELQSSLSQSQQTAKQKAGEVEELQGRLKASRQRVSDLERELTTTTVSNKQFEKDNKYNVKEVDRLKMDLYKTTKLNEELELKCSEMQSKLAVKLSECKSLEERVEDLLNKLSMAELRVKQLSADNDEDSVNQLEILQQEKLELLQNQTQLKASLEKITEDRNQMSESYQQFAKRLNQQIQGLNDQIVSLKEENGVLTQQNSDLNAQMTKLQFQLGNQNEKHEMDSATEKSIQDLQDQVKGLEKKELELKELYQSQVGDNSQLSHLLEEREMKVQELEMLFSEAQNARVDKEKLLEVMQSDKVAASRAMAQNKELKKQLEELQNGFVKMSNDKLTLTETLHEEQHISKELGERLSQQEEELNELRDQLEDKEKQLSLLQKSSTEVTKQMYQQHQIVDRMRHFEAKGQLTEMLQQELSQAQERISGLTNQNSELRTLLANQAERLLNYKDNDSGPDNDIDTLRKDEMVVSLSASVRQLELERNQLLKQLDDQQRQREVLKIQLKEMNEDGSSDIALSEDMEDEPAKTVPFTEYRNLKQTMIKLESRFTKTMNDIAELSDEKQQLEYLVMQLQGETETIGDYIALYQTQRSVMKQQVRKKDEYIATISRDQEELKQKLTELQELVYRLLFEKQQMQEGLATINSKLPGKAQLARLADGDKVLDGVSDSNSNANDQMDAGVSQTLIGEVSENGKPTEPSTNPTRTARKIIDLISEIGSTSLMEKAVPDNFHPCPVCSGRLMTV